MPTTDTLYDDAIALQQKGDIDGAIAQLESIVAQDDAFALAHAALSVFYSRTDRHDQAIEHARRVCELEPADPFSYVAMSLICQKAGQTAEAERAMAQARRARFAAQSASET